MEGLKYWYKFFTEECVVCGEIIEWKERMYTEKPVDASERYEYKQYACPEHFM
jgi:hypothetical protein